MVLESFDLSTQRFHSRVALLLLTDRPTSITGSSLLLMFDGRVTRRCASGRREVCQPSRRSFLCARACAAQLAVMNQRTSSVTRKSSMALVGEVNLGTPRLAMPCVTVLIQNRLPATCSAALR